eukprot:Transcript_13107.p1 GENE.Transcript_13107~~Transcript_13107.p1  ORF type:complete len:1268 (-),score=81.37 Transcript_13107:143-3946(-)
MLGVLGMPTPAALHLGLSTPHWQQTTRCTRSPALARKQRERSSTTAALEVPFHGAGGESRKGFEFEDKWVFEQHFSRPLRRNGTYVELGAHDGSKESNTFWFEHALGWGGLLIEPSAVTYAMLAANRANPKNRLVNGVVCPAGQTVEYIEPMNAEKGTVGGILQLMSQRNKIYNAVISGRRRTLACSPLSELLQQAGIHHVDFFSLDVEGAELVVLNTIDWSAVSFDVIMVELDGKNYTKDEQVRAVLRSQGFRYSSTTGIFCYAEVWVPRRQHTLQPSQGMPDNPRAVGSALLDTSVVANPWLERRQALRNTIWHDGKPPEHAIPLTVTPGNVTGMTQLVWNISEPGLPMHATVFHYLRQTGARTSCAVLAHTGHDWVQCRASSCPRTEGYSSSAGDCSAPRCAWWDNDEVTGFIHNDLACDAYFLYMPLRGPNHQLGYPFLHEFFRSWQRRGMHTLRFFIEPTYLTVSHALQRGYTHVHLMGKSGGAWTATVAAAVDPRITATLAVAGSLPWFIKGRDRSDFEQQRQRRHPDWYLSQANFTTLYLLAALEPKRGFMHVLHEDDVCCFKARGRHADISAYTDAIDAQLAAVGPHGLHATVVTKEKKHAYTKQDRTVLVAALRQTMAASAKFEQPAGVQDLLRAPAATKEPTLPRRALDSLPARSKQICRSRARRTESLSSINYSGLVLSPKEIDSRKNNWVMNFAGQGHIDLAAQLSTAIGLGPIKQGVEAAQALFASGQQFVYMTLTNDHRPRTHREHEITLKWERTLSWGANGARFIGPPGVYTPDSWNKKVFCNMSETMGSIDPALRFGLPCAFGSPLAYTRLLREQEGAPLSSSGQGMPPRWLVRMLRGRGVVAFGSGMRMEVLDHERLKSDPTLTPEVMAASRALLLRFLDPPMLHRGVHLGTPVATRWDTRIFGMVQWEPLRVWVSSHGLIRGGSPWKNYTSTLPLNKASRLLWELSAALDPRCDPLPTERPPWVNPARFAKCSKLSHKEQQPSGCCICQTVADTLDLEHDQRGFATTGTLRKMDHIATDNGLDPALLKKSMDDAITRYLIMQQEKYRTDSGGSRLSRWHTPMAIDVAFGADGRAWVYEGHLVPVWKRAGHFWQPIIDGEYARGAYAPLLLAASHMLVSPAIDQHHIRLLGGCTSVTKADRLVLLEFLRDQGVASTLGFRRAWPSPRHADAARYASTQDLRFAALVDQLGLLLPGLDSLDPPLPGMSDLLVSEFWNFRGKLYTNSSLPHTKCEEAWHVLASWGSTAHAAV